MRLLPVRAITQCNGIAGCALAESDQRCVDCCNTFPELRAGQQVEASGTDDALPDAGQAGQLVIKGRCVEGDDVDLLGGIRPGVPAQATFISGGFTKHAHCL
ncbi:hypothetical protein D3C75_1191750 [compost metagenome]